MIVRAPAKLNLCLYLGPVREDGKHEICSLFVPLTLSDGIEVDEAERDEVSCPGIPPPDLAERALSALRDRGWDGPPLRIGIKKEIPVAAGLGGGSADAAAVLRLAEGVSGIKEVATGLGADVPSQLDPRPSLVRGAGEAVDPVELDSGFAIAIAVPEGGLAAGDVYAEADRLGLPRDRSELDGLATRLIAASKGGFDPLVEKDMLVNDLQPAAVSLKPEIGDALEAMLATGAEAALVSGSGPAVFGVFPDTAGAEQAVESLAGSYEAIATGPAVP
jgi:4-diphosphocytidyl-2-C-methyl-D-erythritol kinase